MNDLRHLHTVDAPLANDSSYSHAVHAGPFIFVSGQGPFDPVSGDVVGDGIAIQTGQVIKNLAAILASAGLGLGDVVKVDAHLADFGLFQQYDEVYRAHFREPRPARKTVSSGLGGILVEMDCVAFCGAP